MWSGGMSSNNRRPCPSSTGISCRFSHQMATCQAIWSSIHNHHLPLGRPPRQSSACSTSSSACSSSACPKIWQAVKTDVVRSPPKPTRNPAAGSVKMVGAPQ
jgi:hypothetical protein